MSPEKAQPTELPARSSITTTAEKVVVTFDAWRRPSE
jgi:hypothetical protein